MILILLNWVYIFLTSLSFGFILKKITHIKNDDISIHHILGLFLISIYTLIFSFFYSINLVFYGVMLSVNILSFLYFRKSFFSHFYSIKKTFQSFNKSNKVMFFFVFSIALAMSATKPSIFDNESYYIQTIKWFNEFGLVKGLGNLHVFYAQVSSWHALQSSFSFPFLNINFNDLNGCFLVLFSFVSIQKLQAYQVTQKKNDLYIGSVLIFMPFFIFFINAPSPDLAVFLISQLCIYLFVKKYHSIQKDDFFIIVCFTIFISIIKITAAILILLPLLLLIKHFSLLRKHLIKPLILSLVVFTVFLIKNSIVSGYLLYPLDIIDVLDVDWKLPKELMQLFKEGTYSAAFDYQNIDGLSIFERFLRWLKSYKLNGIINKLFLLLLLLFPFFWNKKSKQKSVLIIYLISIFYFVLAWNFSPQYRFFFFFLIFLFLQVLIFSFRKIIVFKLFLVFSFLLCLLPFFNKLKLNSYTTIKKTNTTTNVFQLKNSVFPESISSMSLEILESEVDGFKYNSPIKDSYFWTVGNLPLPAVNKQQIEYIQRRYHLVPKLRTSQLKNGFKSMKKK